MLAGDILAVLTTDASGRGNNTHITLRAGDIIAVCGTGSHTGHIDLIGGAGPWLQRR